MVAVALNAHTPMSIDVIDDLLFIGAALSAQAQRKDHTNAAHPFTLQRVETSWISYIASFDEAAGVVILRAELKDHVPTVLKVRALSAIGALPIVLADQPSKPHISRLLQAGAIRVFTRDHSFADLQATLRQMHRVIDTASEQREARAASISDVQLSDRELQVAIVYVGATAPSATAIASLLGLPYTSVRTYLQRARVSLRQVAATSTREFLHNALVADGWIDKPSSR